MIAAGIQVGVGWVGGATRQRMHESGLQWRSCGGDKNNLGETTYGGSAAAGN